MWRRLGQAVVMLIAASPAARAQTDPNMGRWLEQFGAIAGAWYVNGRCKILSTELSREFEWHVAQSNIALHRRGANSDLLRRIQQSGRQVAGRPEYSSCGQKSREVVEQALPIGRSLSFQLTGERYNPKTSEAEGSLRRFTAVSLGLRIARRCGYVEAKLAADIDRVYLEVLSALATKLGTRAVNLALDQANRHPNATTMPCGAEAQQGYLATLSELRSLERELVRTR